MNFRYQDLLPNWNDDHKLVPLKELLPKRIPSLNLCKEIRRLRSDYLWIELGMT